MSGVLDQSEIDALLSSVAAEGPALTTPRPAAAARAGGLGTTPFYTSPKRDVSTYDFKRPERVSKDHIRALSSIHDGFARNFGASLSGFLRTIIDVRVVGVEQLTYSEFIHSLPNPTCFAILQAPPLEGQMCVEVSPLIVYPIIDRLLGGSKTQMYIPQRPLTTIEWRLMTRLINKALEHLSEVWRTLVDAKFQIAATESNPQLVHIVAPTEVVVFITFEIKMAQSAGTMSICIPFNTIESVLSKLTTQAWFGYEPKPASGMERRRIQRTLERSRVDMTVYLGRAFLKLSELRTLREGDIIQLDKPADGELLLQVHGRNKYAVSPGQINGRRAVRLVREAKRDETV